MLLAASNALFFVISIKSGQQDTLSSQAALLQAATRHKYKEDIGGDENYNKGSNPGDTDNEHDETIGELAVQSP